MNDDEDQLSYSHSSIMKSSLDNNSSTDTIFPDRRRVRVQFAYIIDNDQILPITQNTVVKSEPYFHITATEDQPTKQFYRNPSRTHTPSRPDSFEEENHSHWNERQTRSSSPMKSILKKSSPKREEQSRSRSSSLQRERSSSSRLDFNEVQHLAEMTAKQTQAQPSSIYCRSLFDQTMNIFDPDNSYYIRLNNPRPSRLEYYIKPYRGEANHPTEQNKRSRSLGHHSQTKSTRPVSRQSYRKQHVSWSPVRQYIHQGRDSIRKKPPERKERLSSRLLPPSTNVPPKVSPPSSIDSYHSLSDEENTRRDERIERYDRLLEKMRTTDEELQSLSRSWTNKTEEIVPVTLDRPSTDWFNRLVIPEDYFSPMVLQMCLILLVIFNLIVVYFFNEINLWWNEYIAPIIVLEQQNEDTF